MKVLKNGITLGGSVATAYLGGWDIMLRVLVLFVVLDYITGVYAAFCEKHLNSEIGLKGIAKKILLFVVIAVAVAVDDVLGQAIFRSLAIWFYVANEALSILENCALAGVPIPSFLKTALEQLKKKGDEGDENLS